MKIWHKLKGKWRRYTVVIGAVLIQLTFGPGTTIGNFSPYLISYLRQHNDPNIGYNQIIWLSAMGNTALGLFSALGGILDRRVGPRITAILGSIFISFGTAVTYFTIDTTYPFVVLTYGFICGLGCSIAYISLIAVGMRWFPKNNGVVNGIVVSAAGFPPFIFDPVQTAFINPDNVSPGSNGYFTDTKLLNRVPYACLLLAGIFAVMQIIGCLLVTNPPKELAPVQQGIEVTQLSLSPRQAVKTKEFYILWITLLFNGQAMVFFTSFYKTFGQTFIKDDHFLALVGSACALSNALGRIVMGPLVDRFYYKKCMLCNCAYVVVFLLTMQFTNVLNKYVFGAWAFLLVFGFAGTYTLIPTCVSHTYGPKHSGTIHGMVYTCAIFGAPVSAIATQYLLPAIGFNGMFYLLAGTSSMSLIFNAVFQQRSISLQNE